MLTPEQIAQSRLKLGIGASGISTGAAAAKVGATGDALLNKLQGKEPPKEGILKTVGKALISSETGLGEDIAAAATTILPKSWTGQDKLEEAQKVKEQTLGNLLTKLKEVRQNGGDTTKWLKLIEQTTGQRIPTMADLYPAIKKSNLQVIGDAGGTLLDILSVGTYGQAAKGAQTGKLLVKGGGKIEAIAAKLGLPTSEKIITPVVKSLVKPALSTTLKTIGKKTAVRSAVGGATGYGYDVAENLKQKKLGLDALKPGYGTAFGIAVPAVIGAVEAGAAITKDVAPKFINSLIKPKQADFAYGKDPGRTVSEMGITGNNLDDFADNIHTKKQEVGAQLGDIYNSPANANVRIDASDEIKKLDDAIAKAAKGGKENQGIVTTLQNTKDALLYEHGIDAEGNIIRQAAKKSVNITPEQFVKDPGSIPIFRGENAGSAGGVHFTTDPSWARNFGDNVVTGTLPADAKIKKISDIDYKKFFDQGVTNEKDIWTHYFDEGFDAIVGTDAMNSKMPDIIVNPKNLTNFKPFTEAANAGADYISRIVKTTQTGIDTTPELAKKYTIPRLIDTIKADIAQNAKSVGIDPASMTKINELNSKSFDSLDDFMRAAQDVVATPPRDLSALTPDEAFKLKSIIAEQTKFTGKPSDDKTVNGVLKNMYGGMKEKLNTGLGKNNPEIIDLNQKYADLTSAEIATRNREAILKRANIVSMPIKTGIAAAGGIVTALASGGTLVPVVLAGASAAALEKALESTAVKTRIAAWLGSEAPGVIASTLAKNPEIKTVLYRALPKFAAQLGAE